MSLTLFAEFVRSSLIASILSVLIDMCTLFRYSAIELVRINQLLQLSSPLLTLGVIVFTI